MKLTDAQINSFIDAFERAHGERLSRDEAIEEATALIKMVQLTYEPMTQADYDKYTP